MGYIKIETFEDKTDWTVKIPTSNFTLGELDWPSLLSDSDKTKSLSLTFDETIIIENHFEKTYDEPHYFRAQDGAGMTVDFEELVLTVWAKFRYVNAKPYTQVSDFNLSMAIFDGATKLREWFVPLKNTEGYEQLKFDLLPLIEAGYTKFDKLRFGILKSEPSMTVYFGDLFLFQEDVEHNLKVSIAQKLHLAKWKELTEVARPIKAGDLTVTLKKYVDILDGTPIAIGDPNGYYDLHVVRNTPTSKAPLEFTGGYDGAAMQNAYAVNTKVYEVWPATFGDLSQSEQVFSVYYVSTKAPEPVEERSNITTRFDSYVRDPAGNHTVSVRKSIDTSMIAVEIHVYASTPEKGVEMWKYLRSIFDDQSFISVAGESVQYDVINYQQVSEDPDSTEIMPHYILNMNCYIWENVHSRIYGKFPYFKSLIVDQESIPFQDTEFIKKVT